MMDQSKRQCITQQLSAWYQAKHRQVLFAQIQMLLHEWLNGCFGYYAAEISMLEQQKDWFRAKNIPTRFQFGATQSSVITDFENLPIESESLDFIVVCHVLEFIDSPHNLLREIDRVLIPEGRLLIIAFNPYGWQSINRLFRRRTQAPWCGHFYSVHRIKDWLSLLGFDVQTVQHAAIPFGLNKQLLKLSQGFAGCMPLLYSLNALCATKRVSSLKSIGQIWRSPFVKKHIAQPTTLGTPNARKETLYLH